MMVACDETAWTTRAGSLADALSRKVVGQPDALRRIVPYIQMYQTRLNAPDRPAGVFLLLGPSGTGKTRTVEALAEILHGSATHLLKIDCAEYQSDHEVAKLIGAPPGYIGHRETKPLLTQERLLGLGQPAVRPRPRAVRRDREGRAGLHVAAARPARPGDAAARRQHVGQLREEPRVPDEQSRGARDAARCSSRTSASTGRTAGRPSSIADRLQTIGMAAVRRRFSPEFVNRIDAVITYRPARRRRRWARSSTSTSRNSSSTSTPGSADRSFDIVVTPGRAPAAARPRDERRVRRARAEAHGPPDADAAAGGAGGGRGRGAAVHRHGRRGRRRGIALAAFRCGAGRRGRLPAPGGAGARRERAAREVAGPRVRRRRRHGADRGERGGGPRHRGALPGGRGDRGSRDARR